MDLESGELKLDSRTVFVVDEAATVPTQMMDKLMSHVKPSGCRLWLIGDATQTQPVAAGNPFLAFQRRFHDFAQLQSVTRQRASEDREMVMSFQQGEAKAAFQSLRQRGLFELTKTRREAYEALVRDWRKAGEPGGSYCLTPTRNEAGIINRMCQEERRLAGELGPDWLRVGGEEIYASDRVIFKRNSDRYRVRNGDLGTVLRANALEQTLTVKLGSGECVTVPVSKYEHIKLGYAMTVHASQSKTTEHVFALLGGSNLDRELTYVAASRARGQTRVYCDRMEAGPELSDLIRMASRSRQKELAIDVMERPGPERSFEHSR
jgi:ATP-dependent exoDNAse (exonuclease V) alpha subunit